LLSNQTVQKNSDDNSKIGRFLNRTIRFKNPNVEEFCAEIFLGICSSDDERIGGVDDCGGYSCYGFTPK
jgi:hypothetical protein